MADLDLELRLRELAAGIEFPPTPALAAHVEAELVGRPRRSWLRRAALPVALAVLALAVALAVPPARSAILGWLGLRSVSIERTPALPPQLAARLDLGRRVSLREARELLPFRPLVPAALGRPDGVFVRGGELTLVYGGGGGGRPAILVGELRGGGATAMIRKVVPASVSVQDLLVGRDPAVWVAGAHAFAYIGRAGAFRRERLRLARPTLIVQRGQLVVRVEGAPSRARAVAVARSLR